MVFNHLATQAAPVALGLGVMAMLGVVASAGSVDGPEGAPAGTGSVALTPCDGKLQMTDLATTTNRSGGATMTGFTLTVTDNGTRPCAGQTAEIVPLGANGNPVAAPTVVDRLVRGPQQVTLSSPIDAASVARMSFTVSG